ncbi:MAG TPA: amidohydrolase [Dyella sp.]|uniref:amidohydrolase n=1 Tax=Dyella sp. TaxID=1869338 RepID=UPI002C078DB4|nr:amidohydrolase [Dyella sp.]HUB89960.1 amidohydrolase [Dyella sp.]
MQTLNVTLVQGATRWHDAPANREYYGALVRRVAGQSDLVVLPETFLSGFSNDTRVSAEGMDGEGVAWMRALATEVGAVVTGSLAIREDKVYNRLIWARPDGTYAQYDKRHLFRMAGEHTRYGGGSERLIVELKGWRILPQVCYDLRFPVWLRNRRLASAAGGMDYDLALFVANWPAPRRQPWRTLLRARAIENLAYVVGVNRVGVDGNDLPYAGDSAVIDPLGEPLLELGPQEQLVTVAIDPAPLLQHRERFPAWMDADEFMLSDV